MAFSSDDERFMRSALRLSEIARGRTAPNPMVGAVVVRDGVVLAEGFHARAGVAHAEVAALSQLREGAARGATLYVTLEPCRHHGRTPPCTEAIFAAGIGRVVAAMGDPNPRVAGGGAKELRAGGVMVELGLCEAEARALNAGYLSLVLRGRPRVTLKAAVTLDGRLATASGDSRWVTGEEARAEVHRLRNWSDAILVGAGTVRADDPSLTTRLAEGGGRNPLRVILDGRLSISPMAKVVGKGTLIVTGAGKTEAERAPYRARGAEVMALGAGEETVDLDALLAELGRRGFLELLVEGGAAVHGAFLAAHLADRAIVFVAPKIVGAGGVPLAAVAGPDRMAEAWALRDVEVRRLGDDVMIAGDLATRPTW